MNLEVPLVGFQYRGVELLQWHIIVVAAFVVTIYNWWLLLFYYHSLHYYCAFDAVDIMEKKRMHKEEEGC